MSWDTRQHGTHVRYVQGPNENGARGIGCRCEPCRAANRAYEHDRAQRTEPAYVTAGPARTHIMWLRTQGIGVKSIARHTGISHGALSKLIYGDSATGRGPSKRIRPATSTKILAVTPNDFANGTREPAAPVLALVDRLVAAGVPKVRIAERLGQTGPGLQLGRQSITRRNATIIRRMVAELDAGTLVTIKRHRHRDRTITTTAVVRERTNEERDEIDVLILTLAEILEQRIDQNSWRKDAACRNRPTWLFFPARGDNPTARKAHRICDACIVRAQCADANLEQREGIYGGLSAKARRDLRSGLIETPQAS